MKGDNIRLLYAYNEWATKRIFDAAEGIAQDQLLAPNDWGWGDLRGMLVHILNAEIGWRHRLGDQGDFKWLAAADFPDVVAIRARWEAETAKLWEYLDGLSDDDVNAELAFERNGTTRRSARWHFLAHVVNHGTQHRSECAALLTGLGLSPGDLDFTVFLSARPGTA